MHNNLSQYVLFLADSNLILSHRLSEWCGHGPSLEEDIAMSNISLDLLGQARLFYQYAGEILNKKEDELVYFRDEQQFYNLCLVELPQEDYAQAMLILNWYSTFYHILLDKLSTSSDNNLSAIAKKCILEVVNHRSHSERWLKIFAYGTAESKNKLQNAINKAAPYLESCFITNGFDKELIADKITMSLDDFRESFLTQIKKPLGELGDFLSNSEKNYVTVCGIQGSHSEFLGYILTDIQHLAQQYKGAKW